MIKVTATKLRSHLFEYLTKVSRGETVSISKSGQEIAVIMPVEKTNWRSKIKIKPKLKADPEDVFAPMDDIWENYK